MVPSFRPRGTVSDSISVTKVRATPYDGRCEDLFFHVEQLIVEACGEEAAGRLHTARSRNDIDMTMYRLRQREFILLLIEATLDLRDALIAVADRHRGTLLAALTHTQPAQPSTSGATRCLDSEPGSGVRASPARTPRRPGRAALTSVRSVVRQHVPVREGREASHSDKDVRMTIPSFADAVNGFDERLKTCLGAHDGQYHRVSDASQLAALVNDCRRMTLAVHSSSRAAGWKCMMDTNDRTGPLGAHSVTCRVGNGRRPAASGQLGE